MSKVYLHRLRLNQTLLRALLAAADDVHLDLDAYVQRVLQRHVDPSLPMPHPHARQLAVIATRMILLAEGLEQASRALERGEARNHPLQAGIAGAMIEIRDTIGKVAALQDEL